MSWFRRVASSCFGVLAIAGRLLVPTLAHAQVVICATAAPSPTPTATPTPASIINLTGFEMGSDSTAAESVGSSGASISAVGARNGNFGLVITTSKGSVNYWSLGSESSTGQPTQLTSEVLYTRFYFQTSTLPSGAGEPIMAYYKSGAPAASLRLNADGSLSVHGLGGTLVESSFGGTINTSAWYEIQMFANSAGDYAVKVDGSGVIDGSGAVFNGSFDEVRFGRVEAIGAVALTYYYDDIVLKDDTWPGSGRNLMMACDSAGTYTNWTTGTGTTFAEVDEIPNDSDTTYIRNSGGVNVAHSFGLLNTTPAGITGSVIHGLTSWARIRAESTGTISNKIRLRVGLNNYDSPGGYDPGATYNSMTWITANNPATGLPWTLSVLDSLQLGVNTVTSDKNIRCTAMAVFVDFDG